MKPLQSFFISPIIISFLANFAYSDSIRLPAGKIQPKTYEVGQQMPCNWDKNIGSITIYGYFVPGDNGAESYQDTLSPMWIRSENHDVSENIMNLHIGFQASELTKLKEKTLDAIEIDFRATRRKCKSGAFGGFFGSPAFGS